MNKLLRIFQTLFIAAILLWSMIAHACRWDADTLKDEKKKKPEIAEIIFGTVTETVDVPRLQKRISELTTNPRRDDADWWNDFAGAYIQLGQPQKAVDLLEPILEKFKDNYGVHANLGTAYHLLGRYPEAEKEIARDLKINSEAHFGLEKYHLALLQYLTRDAKYQSRHVYVDEYSISLLEKTPGFFFPPWEEQTENLFIKAAKEDFPKGLVEAEKHYEKIKKSHDEDAREDALRAITALDPKPSYREKWNLANDPKFEEGIIYLASLNPKQPACFVMVGIASWKNLDLNLAAAAFEKAIKLGSPQSEILKRRIKEIRDHIKSAQNLEKPAAEQALPKKGKVH